MARTSFISTSVSALSANVLWSFSVTELMVVPFTLFFASRRSSPSHVVIGLSVFSAVRVSVITTSALTTKSEVSA